MSVENWDEFRTAFQVAKQGTVSGAAHVLGVHHATVIRHIDSLESRLEVKLFQRHPRGYTPTEAGQDLFAVAQATDDQFAQLVSRMKGTGSEITGELVVTTVPGIAKFIVPVLAEFQRQHEGLIVRLLSDVRVYRLEYGEAHVAIRAGQPPQEPDNVVQRFFEADVALYATQDYLTSVGFKEGDDPLEKLHFIAGDVAKARAPYHAWLQENVSPAQISFRATDVESMWAALMNGAGAGFMMTAEAQKIPELVQISPPRSEWTTRTWLVTHVDLHRTPKVQAFLSFLKDHASNWDCDHS